MTRAKDISKIITDADFSGTLDVAGELQVGVDGTTAGLIRLMDSGSVTEEATISTDANGGLIFGGNSGPGELIFRTGSSTERLKIDSSGDFLFLGGTIRIKDSGNTAQRGAIYGSSSEFHLNAGVDNMVLTTSGGEAMRITSLGNVGIGTSSPTGKFQVDGGRSYFSANSDAFALYLRYNTSTAGVFVGSPSTDTFTVSRSGGQEHLRIDSSGNLLVGKTSASLSTTGIYVLNGGATGITRSASTPLAINRLSNDGGLIDFLKDGTTVGSIGSNSSKLYIAGGNAGFKFRADLTCIMPCNSDGSNSDNDLNLGQASVRWSTIFATNSTINTSDRNEKQDIEELSDAEQRVAVACKGLMRKYRWKSSVAEKGDNARTHFGIIAQDLQDAFIAEGLDASKYAMFCSDTWWELDGETYYTEEEAPEGATQKTRLGVRYNQLLAFIISAI